MNIITIYAIKKMKAKYLSLLLISFQFGCASPPAPLKNFDEIDHRLAQVGQSVAESLAQLAIVEQSARGVHAQAITPADLPADLKLKVSLDYQGDIEPLVNQLAITVGYKMNVYGRRRSITPVSINADAREIGLILADADYQSSWRCDVFVVAPQKIIEIRYNRSRPKA